MLVGCEAMLEIKIKCTLIMVLVGDVNDEPCFVRDTISYSEICLFCATSSREKVGKEDMVLCDQCQVWYHCSCVGIAQVCFDGTDIPFFCCRPPPDWLNFV